MIGYIYSKELETACNRLPSNKGRSALIHRLIAAYGLLSDAGCLVINPKAASRADLIKYHDERFIDTLLSFDDGVQSDTTDSALQEYGLEYDCPVFSNMGEYIKEVAGASMSAARALLHPDLALDTVVNWDGGRHHAKRSSASGFCYVQDIVLAIQELRKEHSRVLYIDFDLHHGDGVEAAFIYSEKVLTLSIHRHDPGFFPNSGSAADIGKGKGRHYSLDVPTKRGLSDNTLLQLTNQVILPTIDAYNPQSIVVQCGVDGLGLDPCRECNLSIDGICATIGLIQEQARERAIKTLYLGGGGYHPSLASQCYACILSQLTGQSLAPEIPEHELWHAYEGTNHELARHAKINNMPDENVPLLPRIIETAQAQIQQIKKKTRSDTVP